MDALGIFHPLLQRWFNEKVGSPTDIQLKSWPIIAEGGHVLISAPTGSGKTLTAFLWAINELLTGKYQAGRTSVLYISPMKALNNDIQKNLLGPLASIQEFFEAEGVYFPKVNVLTRSGDTPEAERRSMLKYPPEILITTPESLNIMLTGAQNRRNLSHLKCVILDEIHALADSKRGTYLITAVDRLVPLSGEFQRVAISATVRPMELIGDFVGGLKLTGSGGGAVYEKRRVSLIQSTVHKEIDLEVRFPDNAREKLVEDSWWPVIAEDLKKIIRSNNSTLLFANSRRITEKVARLINENESETLAYSHHGSISKELRLAVEQKLKKGELKSVVATNSLELGIDIGELDQVVLVQTPRSLSSAIQRVGRSGHGVGQVSRGVLYPTHGMDFIEAAVMTENVIAREIEAMKPVENPLDILAQVVLSMTIPEVWDIDSLYETIRTSWPFRELTRRHYDLIVSMLAGKYADTRLKDLKPRVIVDKLDNTIRAKEGAAFIYYLSCGTIPDRGYYDLRLMDTRAKIGELDEEFVWERKVGETFSLGPQVWRILSITNNDVLVKPAESAPNIIPFWKAEDLDRDFYYAEKIAVFLEDADRLLAQEDLFREILRTKHHMSDNAAGELIEFLNLQKASTKRPLPHRHHLLIEHFDDPANKNDRKQIILHTMWGGEVNRPFGLCVAAAWENKYGTPLEVMVNNTAVLAMLPLDYKTEDLLELLQPDHVEEWVRQKLESTGYFGAKFRENAGRALLLPKAGFKNRLPLWLNRLRSKRLLESISRYDDFPILIETWRECLQDEMDISNLKMLLEEIKQGTIQVSETLTHKPSAFSSDMVWKQFNKFIYMDDTPASQKMSNLSSEIMEEILHSEELRPRILSELIVQLEEKLQRTAPGYAPASVDELVDWVRERLFIPNDEWRQLLLLSTEASGLETEGLIQGVLNTVAFINTPDNRTLLAVAIENIPLYGDLVGHKLDASAIQACDGGVVDNNLLEKAYRAHQRNDEKQLCNPERLLAQWLSFYGPMDIDRVSELLGLESAPLLALVGTLVESGAVITGELSDKKLFHEICDKENLERLLRMARQARNPVFQALPPEKLQLFIALQQGLVRKELALDGLKSALEKLFGYGAPAEAWEKYIFSARLEPYYPSWLDTLLQSGGLVWYGTDEKETAFSFEEDLELFLKPLKKGVFEEWGRKYTFFEAVKALGVSSEEASLKLWNAVWHGSVMSDSFEVLRKGIQSEFTPVNVQDERPSGRRSGLSRWSNSRPMGGNWFNTPLSEESQDETDLIHQDLLNKDRARVVLNRYGILFREVLAHETVNLQWKSLFKTLRLMELSGEILSGHFFEGIPGIQFMTHEAFRTLQRGLPEDAFYWMNAVDPASLCGKKLPHLKGVYPKRLSSSILLFQGDKLVLVSEKSGKTLSFNVPPGHSAVEGCMLLFKTLMTREFEPVSGITVEEINGEKAVQSPYAADLKKCGFTSSYKALELWKKY